MDSWRSLRAILALGLVALSMATVFAASAAAATVLPYGANDAGGFRNVLPPGENGLLTASQLLKARGLEHILPPHYADQQQLYEGLVYGSPTLTEEQIPLYFKDATFGVPPAKSNPRSTPGRG